MREKWKQKKLKKRIRVLPFLEENIEIYIYNIKKYIYLSNENIYKILFST